MLKQMHVIPLIPLVLLAACAEPRQITAPSRSLLHPTIVGANVVDIGTLGGSTSWISEFDGLNEAGQAVGRSFTSGNLEHAFRWTPGVGIQDLGTLGGPESYAFGINNAGDVVGHSYRSGGTGEFHAFRWTSSSGMLDLGTLGGVHSVAIGINDVGDVVGNSLIAGNQEQHGFRWTASGGMEDLGTLGGNMSLPFAINSSSQVVGYSRTSANREHAFLWTPGSGMQDLGTLGGSWSRAHGINDAGEVVGNSGTAGDLSEHAFRWTAASGMQDLGTLGGSPSYALSISGSGYIVGVSATSSGVRHSFLWSPSDGMEDITPATGLSFLSGINNNLQVGFSRYIATINFVPNQSPNQPPTAQAVSVSTVVNTSAPVSLAGSDPEGGALTYQVVTAPQHGTLSGVAPALTYTPNANYSGGDAFTYMTVDTGGLSSSPASVTITVSAAPPPEPNVAPIVTAISLPVAPVAVNSTVALSASFADANSNDTHVASINWEAGTTIGSVAETNGAGTVGGSFTFATPGIYTATVSVSDATLTGSRSSALDLPAYVVVYDPSAGFVTGGGWFDSPVGACTLATCAPDGSTMGKATFAFVSNYKQGASAPSGNAEFHFTAGGLRFASTSYQWLVVAGSRAQYKGDGTVNGLGSYGFMITAIDGALIPNAPSDRFRIKIWDKATGAVVYDNQRGSPEDSDEATAIAGGSIVIHK